MTAPAGLLTTRDAAGYLGIDYYTLTRWRGEQRGPTFIRFGSTVRYRVSDLDAYVDAHAVPGGGA